MQEIVLLSAKLERSEFLRYLKGSFMNNLRELDQGLSLAEHQIRVIEKCYICC